MQLAYEQMKKTKLNIVGIRYYLLLLLCFNVIHFNLFGQPPAGTPPTAPPSATGGDPCWDSQCIPIDGGIIFLIIAGLILSAKLFYKIHKEKTEKTNSLN